MEHDTLLRFVKDQKVPITIFDEPYFSYYMDLYDKDFHTKASYEMLQQTVAKFKSEASFLEEYYRIRNLIIEKMTGLPEYKAFLSADMSAYQVQDPKLPNTNKIDVYKIPNIGNYYVSIDLRKANFQMFRKFNPNLIFGAKSYEDLISKFTDMEYFKRSKYIRQVIFGNMNPRRQTTMQKFYTKQILDLLLSELGFKPEDIAVFTFDEIVIRRDGYVSHENLNEMEQTIKQKLDLDVSATSFRLNNVGGKEYFVKEFQDGTITMKGVPNTYFPQVYKKYRGLELTEYDLVFYYEGNPARFLKPLF